METPAIYVGYREINKPSKRQGNARSFGFVFVEHAGWDRSYLHIQSRSGTGHPMGSASCANSAEGVKSILRKLRDQERATLAACDAEIADLDRQLIQARHRRRLALQEAFSKGHVVRLNELEIHEPVKP